MQRYLKTVFILNALIFSFQAFTKSVYPPLLVPLKLAFDCDDTAAGLLVTMVFFGYALARFPSGLLADRFGLHKIAVIGGFAMAVSFITVSFAQTYSALLVSTFVLGVSSGIYVTAGYTLAVVIFSRQYASTATAAFEMFGVAAAILSPFLVTAFITYLSWPYLFAVPGLLLVIVTYVFSRNKLEQSSPGSPAKQRHLLGQMFSSPAIRRFLIWTTLVGGLGAISWTGIGTFIPSYLIDGKGYPYSIANAMFSSIAISGLTAKLAFGWLADRYGTLRLLMINLTLSVLLFFALVHATAHWQLMIILILLGAACLNTNTLINSHVLRLMPHWCQGTGFGVFCTAYTVIYSCGPYLTGRLSTSFGLSTAIQISSLGAIAAIGLLLFAKRFSLDRVSVRTDLPR